MSTEPTLRDVISDDHAEWATPAREVLDGNDPDLRRKMELQWLLYGEVHIINRPAAVEP